jgi:2'-5' RNA ligase
MAPNWFIAFPMQVESLRRLPTPPPRVRILAIEDRHVTVAFLGSVQEEAARRAWDAMDDLRSLRPVFGTFTGVEALGHPRKPSALSAIVDTGREALTAMIGEAREPLLDAAGAPDDTRPPLPHMTLARIQRRAKAGERREALAWSKTIDLSDARFKVTSVALYTWAEERQERLFRIVQSRPLPI